LKDKGLMKVELKHKISKKYLRDLTYEVIGAAIDVHKELGPGLLESVYHRCMKHELNLRGIRYTSELSIAIVYKGLDLDSGLRSDLFIEECFVVELKAVDEVHPVHEAKILSYMKLLNAPQGIMINFNCANIFKEGQKTYVNELFRDLPDE